MMLTLHSPSLLRFLAAWLAIVSSGTSVTHAHSNGHRFHTHGLGLHANCARMESNSSDTTPCEVHRHLILLGLELLGDCQNSPVTPPYPQSISVAGVAFEPIRDDGVDDGTTLTILPTELSADQSILDRPAASMPPDAAVRPLCAFALRQLTGVLRS